MSKRKNICLVGVSPENSHSQKISKGVFVQCEKYGYNVAQFASMTGLQFYFEDYKHGEKNIYKLINFAQFDGIILDTVSLITESALDLCEDIYRRIKEQTSAPVVCIGTPYKGFDTIDNINDEQIREICRHAIEVHGCKDICLLTGFKDNHESMQRLDVMLDEIGRHGLSVTDEHIVFGDFWYQSGVDLAHDIIEGRISKPDAVISASDHMALGFIEEYTKLGGRVPEDICVVGFDATPEGMLDEIPLTSIESNFAKCAADAVDRIRSLIEPGEPIVPYESDITKMMHIGQSCGCDPEIKRILNEIKNSLYFMARNYDTEMFDDNIDIGLLMENYIPEKLTAAKDPQDCIHLIFNMTYIIAPFKCFYLCLHDKWLDLSSDIINGYPEKIRMVLKRVYGDSDYFFLENQSYLFDTSLMLPQMFEESDEPSAFYFSAVHFQDKMLGYAVLQRKLSDYKKFNLVYRNWLRFVSSSLEMVRAKNRFFVLSIHDKMTGLLNRRGMYEQVELLLDKMTDDKEFVVCVIDMDGLKYINDTFGHSDGDYGIKLVSRAALSITEDGDVCARAGGDEFYIAGLRAKGSFNIEKCTENFSTRLSELSDNAGKPFAVTASIGFAVGTGRDIDFEEILSEADGNMYRFKMLRKRHRN